MKQDCFSLAPPIIKEFLGYMGTVKGKSPLTVEEYFMDLRTFFRYMKQHRNQVPQDMPFDEISIDDIDLEFIKTITLTDVYEYMNFVSTQRKNKATTRSRKVSSLRTYFQYLTNKVNKLEHNPITELETPKTKKSLPKYLTLEQSMDLLNAVEGPYQSRDYCIITLFLNCGMRLSELVNINLNDINHKEHVLAGSHACYAVGCSDATGRSFTYYTVYRGKLLSFCYKIDGIDADLPIDGKAKKMLRSMIETASYDQ